MANLLPEGRRVEVGAGEMIQLVEVLPCKHKDQSPGSQHPWEKAAVHIWSPSTGEPETGGFLELTG